MIAGQRLPVVRYRFQLRALDPIPLQAFAGYTLRGVLGKALRHNVCVTGQPQCPPCPLYQRCAYPRLFDPPRQSGKDREPVAGADPPSPYVIEPPPLDTALIPAGEQLSLGLVLFGQALQELPQFVQALRRAFADNGVGHHGLRGRAELEDVRREDGGRESSIWEAHGGRVFPWAGELVVPDFPSVTTARLRFLTPLSLKHQGKILGPDAVNARTLLTAIMRRATLLFSQHAGMRELVQDPRALAQKAQSLTEERALRAYGTQRYSASQRREIPLEGVVGEWTLRGDLSGLAPWLWLGQWLHVGKSAVMGLGRYHLQLS